jgi:DNA mismatch repair protein MutL
LPKINVLDISVANLIAAGEVVERPASVVKELLENSVDAGATQITVEIKRGGITFIRVADNGCGIAREDVPIALKRHATSKIADASDLASIMTLGFRGEALAAISSVAHVRIITRTREEHIGTLLQSNPDGEVGLSDTGAPVGTTVIVEELFANVPARLKFLKKDTGEQMAVTAIVEKLALSRSDIAIRYISDGTLKFETAGTGKLEDAIYAVLGRDFARALVPVDEMTEGIYVSGFVGAPESARGNRNYENVFVNGRYVKSLTVSTAVEQAFESYIPGDKFPVCVLSVAIHPSLVDVNVHPTKLEVKFSNERAVFEAVYCAVRNALMTRLRHVKLDTPQVKLTGDDLGEVAEIITERLDKNEHDGDLTRADMPPEILDDATAGMNGDTQAPASQAAGDKPAHKPTEGDNSALKQQSTSDKSAHKTDVQPSPPRERDYTLADSAPGKGALSAKKASAVELDDILANIDTAESLTPPETSDLSTEDEPPKKPADVRSEAEISFDPDVQFRVAGILFNCYIIVESGERVFIIDKHAAHERILFEDMKKRLRGQGDAQAQLLFIPIELTLSPQERAAVAEFTTEFDALGYGYTELDNDKTGLIQIPADLPSDAAGELFATLASSLADGSGTPRSERDALYERALYTASCKAAMKAGRDDGGNASLSWLVRRVLTDSAVRVCPHGRPVAVEADKSWLARLFLRA